MKRKLLLTFALGLILVTCTSLLEQPAVKVQPPTLQITNWSSSSFALIYDRRRIGTVAAGQTSCIVLRMLSPTGNHELFLRPLADSRYGSVPLPIENFHISKGWRMSIQQSPALDVYSLETAAACSGSQAGGA